MYLPLHLIAAQLDYIYPVPPLPPPPAPAPPLAGVSGGDSPPAGVTSLSLHISSPPHEAGAGPCLGRGLGLRRRGRLRFDLHRMVLDPGGGPWRGSLSPAAGSGVGVVPAIWSGGRRISGGLGPRVAALAAGGARSGCWLSSLLGALLLRRFLGVLDGLPMGCGRFWWSGSRSGETRVGSGWPRRRRRPRAPISSWRRLSRSALPLPTT